MGGARRLAAAAACFRAGAGARWPALQRGWPAPAALAALLVLGTLLCLTSSRSLGALPLLIGLVVGPGGRPDRPHVRLPRLGRSGGCLDVAAIVVVVLAVPDVVVYRPSGAPEHLLGPGIVQFQQDYLLGPANQLLGGGALLVNGPSRSTASA